MEMGKKQPPVTGRPEIPFSQDAADLICEITATSNTSLVNICKNKNLPGVTTIHKWLRENEAFSADYARAKEAQADFLAEEMLEIADDSRKDSKTIIVNGQKVVIEDKEYTSRVRLMLDTRKFIASKLKPKKYGDKLDLNHSGEVKTTMEATVFQIARRKK